jgi:hypothetical protein
LLEGAFVLVHDGARPDIELTASGTGESGLLRVGTRVWGFDSSGVSTATVASSFDPSGVVAADWRDEYGRAIALEGRTASGGRAWRVRPADPVEQAGLVRVDGELSSGLREKTRITTSGPCYLSPRSAAALFRVHRAFRQRGLAARLLTCYRPLSTGGPSPSEPAHAHGAAIDIESGAGMPEIDSMPRCRGAAGHGSLDPLMVRVLAAAGFRPVSGWHLHFEGPDARSAPLIGVPIPDHR